MNPSTHFDRSTQDLGNIVFFEHVNLRVPDQGLAMVFYLEGLGLTRDPFYMVGTGNMWVNVGRQQIHLENGRAQRFRGHLGMVLPDLGALQTRLAGIESRLAGTQYQWNCSPGVIIATCPWGNTFRIYENYECFPFAVGIPCVTMKVPFGAARRIASFYSGVLQAGADLSDQDEAGQSVTICAGPGQKIVYSETRNDIAAYDGHHICIYISNFSSPYRHLKEQGMITAEDNEYQYRFEDIKVPGDSSAAYALQHEVRSLYHPLYLRPLVNRTGEERLP